MFRKPNTKNFTTTAVQAISLGVGIKVGDGIAAIMPESTASYKNWIVGAAGLALAACVNPSTTAGLAVQSAVLGVAASGFYNGITEAITPSIDVQDNTTTMGRFVNAVAGHKTEVPQMDVQALNAANWEPTYEVNEWDRPEQEEAPAMRIALG